MKKPIVIIITGPTASGKSALAISLAEKLQTEIISADSRQIYNGIPIVTAVPTLEERKGITHHLLEVLPLDSYYSAAKFQEDSDNLIKSILAKNDTAIICGGSMLYIDALIKGIDELPTVSSELRNGLMTEWKVKGDTWLKQKLKNLDPVYFNKVDLNNLKRIFHAIEISITAGKPYSSLLTKPNRERNVRKDLPYRFIKVCLSGSREYLFEKINDRVIKMMADGLEEEARKVYPLRHLNSLNTVGLKEMFARFDGLLTKEEAVLRIQKNTRVYAKKQITWNKLDNNLYPVDFQESITNNTNRILSYIRKCDEDRII